ncbi:hypothetical protein PPYR_13159 [Photinus pyralis]|uniref:Uncharacterized protein n=1 Tax=Photinus pyralis TaxID=7054 RepID=A0A5N4A8B8_PHOPY|nr:uncharacterized protein LOC116179678 [Photinus pyralis]KAB0793539.1 hypothetical protein PPYR_13159 [Photinus pyralis]
MLDEEVKQILQKYQIQESEINKLLQLRSVQDHNGSDIQERRQYPSHQEAVTRNKSILKDLETAKGALRSKAIYSPSEVQWESICKCYLATPSLPTTSWKCHMSVFV